MILIINRSATDKGFNRQINEKFLQLITFSIAGQLLVESHEHPFSQMHF